jgi:hypothetical protein
MGAKFNLVGMAALQVKWGKFICSIFYSNIHDFMFKTLKVVLMRFHPDFTFLNPGLFLRVLFLCGLNLITSYFTQIKTVWTFAI